MIPFRQIVSGEPITVTTTASAAQELGDASFDDRTKVRTIELYAKGADVYVLFGTDDTVVAALDATGGVYDNNLLILPQGTVKTYTIEAVQKYMSAITISGAGTLEWAAGIGGSF